MAYGKLVAEEYNQQDPGNQDHGACAAIRRRNAHPVNQSPFNKAHNVRLISIIQLDLWNSTGQDKEQSFFDNKFVQKLNI